MSDSAPPTDAYRNEQFQVTLRGPRALLAAVFSAQMEGINETAPEQFREWYRTGVFTPAVSELGLFCLDGADINDALGACEQVGIEVSAHSRDTFEESVSGEKAARELRAFAEDARRLDGLADDGVTEHISDRDGPAGDERLPCVRVVTEFDSLFSMRVPDEQLFFGDLLSHYGLSVLGEQPLEDSTASGSRMAFVGFREQDLLGVRTEEDS